MNDMDKTTFASYKFKPSDVIEGLNRYFAETKANRYLRVPLEIKNGTVKPGNYYVIRNICDPEEVVGVAINWLREEHDIFYTPGMEVPREDFDVEEASKEYEKATRKDRIEELKESRRDLIEALQKRLHDAQRRIVALEEGHKEKNKIIDQQKTAIKAFKELEEQLRKKANENSVLRSNLDYFANLAQGRQKALSNLRYEILKVYREIFDCSDGDPEGTDEETLQDILTEYKRTLELKNVAEEKTIKYKELARENEERANKYKDTAKENRVQWNNTKAQLQWFKKRVAKELCMSEDSTKAEIITAVNAIMDHATDLTFNAVDKDNYEAFRKTIWEAMGRKPETLPEEDSRIVSEVAIMKEGEKHLLQFRDEIAKAIGITYPTTNNFITTRVVDIYKDWGELNDLIPKLRGDVRDLQVKCNDMRSKFEFQSGLRQQWHARYESEHERANGVQKCLDKTREALRVKDISLEAAKKQYEKVCGNLETVECALNGMKSKVRELREEKTKVISALGQDIWDDCVK